MKMVTFDPTKPIPDGAELYCKSQKVIWWAYDQEEDRVVLRYDGFDGYFMVPPKDLHLMLPSVTKYVNLYLAPWGKIVCKTFDTYLDAIEDANKVNEDSGYKEAIRVAMEVEV